MLKARGLRSRDVSVTAGRELIAFANSPCPEGHQLLFCDSTIGFLTFMVKLDPMRCRVFSLSRESGERQYGEQPGGIGAQCRRDVGMAGAAQDPDGGIAQGGHDLGRMARANLAAIFIEGDVAHPMQTDSRCPNGPAKGRPGWWRRPDPGGDSLAHTRLPGWSARAA